MGLKLGGIPTSGRKETGVTWVRGEGEKGV